MQKRAYLASNGFKINKVDLAFCKIHFTLCFYIPNNLFERLYEDNVAGKISDERFSRMSLKYEHEQAELADKIKSLKATIKKAESLSVTADMFITTVRKYTRAKKLTAGMLNELIQRIEVHQAEKVNGVWEQHLTIHYNCVGVIDIPECLEIPSPTVSVSPRRGVVVSYAPNEDEAECTA